MSVSPGILEKDGHGMLYQIIFHVTDVAVNTLHRSQNYKKALDSCVKNIFLSPLRLALLLKNVTAVQDPFLTRKLFSLLHLAVPSIYFSYPQLSAISFSAKMVS